MYANHRLDSKRRGCFAVLALGALILTAGCASGGMSPDGDANQTTEARVESDSRMQAPPAPQTSTTPAQQPPTKHPLDNAHLTLHVGKTGKLARLGHNHLITGNLNGTAWLDAQGTLHAAASIKVSELIVDDPGHRAAQVAAGNTDYSSVPSTKNISDTRSNMLGAKVLDAANFPELTATALATSAAAEFANADAGHLSAQFRFTLKGASSTQSSVLTWHRTNQAIHWRTTLSISHQQFGMTPFSALGGALRVADDIGVELKGSLPDPFSLGSD